MNTGCFSTVVKLRWNFNVPYSTPCLSARDVQCLSARDAPAVHASSGCLQLANAFVSYAVGQVNKLQRVLQVGVSDCLCSTLHVMGCHGLHICFMALYHLLQCKKVEVEHLDTKNMVCVPGGELKFVRQAHHAR